MTPTIQSKRFIGQETPGKRHIEVSFTDGTQVEIHPLETCGQHTFIQSGASQPYYACTLDLAVRHTRWLNGLTDKR